MQDHATACHVYVCLSSVFLVPSCFFSSFGVEDACDLDRVLTLLAQSNIIISLYQLVFTTRLLSAAIVQLSK
jgi:hypothetical protein